MAEHDEDPRPPRPPAGQPGKPLPRTRYSLPPDEDKEPASARSKKKGSDPARRDANDDAPKDRPKKSGSAGPARASAGGEESPRKRVLKEETPEFDTFEARQNVRRIIGGVAAVAIVVSLLFVLMRATGSGDASPYVEDDGELAVEDTFVPTAPPAATPAGGAVENEASIALDDARRSAQQGNGDLALKRLEGVVKGYPKTKAAAKAKEALERGGQGLPLFVDAPLVVAQKPEAETPPLSGSAPETAPTPVVVAAEPPKTPDTAGASVVELHPPSTPAEPRRETDLAMPKADVPARALPAGFRARPEAGVHPTGWPLEITSDQDGATLVYIPGGTFLAGRNDAEPQEKPAHRVTVTPFYMDQHEVTAGQYARFLAASGGGSTPNATDPALPATKVAYSEAEAYAAWAGRSLPSEAQWELAARTTDGRAHPWGAAEPRWATPRRAGQIDRVMSYDLDLSPYGVFDLAGNAREWTRDYFKYYDAPSTVAPVNPVVTTPGKQKTRVIKGGADDWSASWRSAVNPSSQLADVGFRCVLNLPEAPAPTPPAASNPPGEAPPPVPSNPQPGRQPGGAVPF